MNISIFGLGYVGCVGLACLAAKGHRVIGVDLQASKVNLINEGQSPIIEEMINEMISRYRNSGLIMATNDSKNAVLNTDISFICVGTPSDQNGHTDTTAIFKVADEIGIGIKDKANFHTIVIRSTVPPGTNQAVCKKIARISGKRKNRDFAVVSNPEFLREGTAVKDYFNPPFTLVATECGKAVEIMKTLYSDIQAPFLVSDISVSEMIKYVNNAFHALKITFANEIGNICRKLNINSHKLMDIFCMDKRLNLSSYYLKPGFAYGGSCLPKDLKALQTIAHDAYVECPIIENIHKSNELQKNMVLKQIIDLKKDKLGILGLSFKAETDDLRNSPIIDILEQLLGKGYSVKIFDENVQLSKLVGSNQEFILHKIPLISKFMVDSIEELISGSEVIVIVNKEKNYGSTLQNISNNKIILDLVNLELDKMSENINYMGLSW